MPRLMAKALSCPLPALAPIRSVSFTPNFWSLMARAIFSKMPAHLATVRYLTAKSVVVVVRPSTAEVIDVSFASCFCDHVGRIASSPSPRPGPHIHHARRAALHVRVDNEIPFKVRTCDARMVRPHQHPLPNSQLTHPLALALPH